MKLGNVGYRAVIISDFILYYARQQRNIQQAPTTIVYRYRVRFKLDVEKTGRSGFRSKVLLTHK